MLLINRMLAGLSPKSRLALDQTGLLISLLIWGWMFGLIPDRDGAILAGRAALAEVVAINTSVFITRSDIKRIESNLRAIAERDSQLLSAAVKRRDGKYLATIGKHIENWNLTDTSVPTDSQVIVPMFEGQSPWGQIELRFQPLHPEGWKGFLYYPGVQLAAFLVIMSYFAFHLYLGKMLKNLDPSQVIPDRVRSAMDTVGEGLLIIDQRQNIVLANEAFSSIVNQPSANLIGRRITTFPWFNPNDAPFNDQETPWKVALLQKSSQMGKLVRLELGDSTKKTFMTNSSPVMVTGTGKVAGILISFDDISELKEKELELRKSKDDADLANRAKSDFLANMSHEIRTPMNAILGFAEVLKRGYAKNTEDNTKYLDTIVSSGSHLLNLINDILDLSKVEAGHIEVENRPCALHRIIQEIIQVMEVRALEKNIYLKYLPEGPLPEQILSDSIKLRQILTNLVGNSIKFTDEGGVTVITRMSASGIDPTVTIEVRDTGIGMTKAQADSVFEAFVQADSSITRRFGGTGLGLTISKRFAQALGGDILVNSEEGKGSVFRVRIPTGPMDGIQCLEPEEVLNLQKTDRPSGKLRWKFSPAKVLVVDDGNENRELLKVLLEDTGLQIETAENGLVGYVKASYSSFDLILMDVEMPEMDGYTCVRRLRENGLQTPVIALTAHAMKGMEQKCLDAGYSGYITKPIDIDRLMERISKDLDGSTMSSNEDQVNNDTTSVPSVVSGVKSAPVAPIRSSLPMSNPKFRQIVEKFIVRLEEQIQYMERTWQDGDFDELANLAHWLKGSGGSVGFDHFTEPARELEEQAKKRQIDSSQNAIALIKDLQKRIVIPTQDGDRYRFEDTSSKEELCE